MRYFDWTVGGIREISGFDNAEFLNGWMESPKRIVGQSISSDTSVSTVFLAMNHAQPGARPLVFESLLRTREADGTMGVIAARYTSPEDAVLGHAALVAEHLPPGTDLGWGEIPIAAGLVRQVPATPPDAERDLERIGSACEELLRR